jgi:hypothetical protein
MRKILIAVPCMDQLPAQFAHSLATLTSYGIEDTQISIWFNLGSLIYTSRDQIAKKALLDEADLVMWFDSDMVFNPDTLKKMLEHIDNGADFVTGIYYRRTPPFSAVAFKTMELNEDGTGIFNVEEAEKITWGNGKLTADDGSYLNYQLENGELLVDLEGEMLHFVLEAGALNPGNAVVDTGLTPNDLEYWAGDYYGWWVYDNVIVGNSDMNGMWWDCCMSLEIEPDGTGFITIWDEDYGKDDPIGAVDVSVSVYDGVARVVSESGWFMGCEVKHADWLFYSDSTGYDDTLGFFVPYEDSELKIDCYFFMRKWGTIWDDVEAEDMPGYYDSWYLPLIQEGVTAAPDTIG